MAPPRVEAASIEQRRLLRRILGEMGDSRLRGVRVARFDREPEGDPPATGPVGEEIAVVTARGDLRAQWEAWVVSRVFALESKRLRLPKVVWFSTEDGGMTLVHLPPAAARLAPEEVARARDEVVAAAADTGLVVERIDVLQPLGHALAIVASVEEPHEFLRHRAVTFLGALAGWREHCEGIFCEIRDTAPEPVLTVGWFRNGGFHGTRPDVECCAPQLSMSRGMGWRPPRCPIFD
jgi:hypothetical protein